jgi:arylsulfatase A-like enzyme
MIDGRPETTGADRPSFAAVATLIAWGALAGAHLELAARAFLFATRPTMGTSFHFNPMAIAIGPMVNLPLFAAAAAIAWAVAARRNPSRIRPAIIFATSALVVLEVALVTRQVHWAALAILAAGCASVAMRVANRFPLASTRFFHASTAAMAVIAVTGAAWLTMRSSIAEKRALSALPTPPSDSPNVVVLILDTVRAIELGLYGNARPVSPNLDSLARNAIRFEYAYATAPWTLPSHTTMLTGRYPHEFSADWLEPYDGAHPLLSELLRDRGYATGAFVGNIVYLSRRWGLDRGFIRYEDYQADATALRTTSNLTRLVIDLLNTESRYRVRINGIDARVIRERFSRWQRSLDDRPFFAFINLFDAHAPYGAPAPFDTMFLGRRPRSYDINDFRQRDAAENAELLGGYQQAIAYLDAEVGALVDDLRQRGVLDRTLLVITSDHGEDFGEHGYSGHGGGVHATQSRVPLLIVPPRFRGSLSVGGYVTLRDLAATIAEATRLEPGSVPGKSLSRHWTVASRDSMPDSPVLVELSATDNLTTWYPAAHGALRSIVQDRTSYTMRDGGGEWLYDLDRDPIEQVDLATDTSFASTVSRLRAALLNALGPEPKSTIRAIR